ncbi:MAG: PEP-utilizing enzyme [Planctomycetota bacterium]|jgi:pyruvate,water dikinase
MTNEQILEFCSKLTDDLSRFCSGILLLFDVFAAYPALRFLCRRWFNDPAHASKLVAGMSNMTDAEAAIDLWKLAKIVDNLPELKERIIKKNTWQSIYPELPDIPNAKTFLGAWNEFMRDHGHHCRAEIELINPRWVERPDYILSIIRGYLESIEQTDPVENHQRTGDERYRLEKDCRDRFKNPIKRWLFNRILQRAQTGSVWRENIKSELVKTIAVMRKTLLELGRRLVANGTLDDPDDIFFLKLEESSAVAQSRANFDIKQLIADRRAEHEKWTAITPPNTIVGRFDPEDYAPDPGKTNGEVLKGLALSHGVATGKAKVILRADADQYIRVGEILVAPFTDPGWTPYFIGAAAVVTEHGGLLSHGAIVARELAIPAVTNVGPATQIIKTGQTIQVDGNAGTVKIIE